jgi:hypothetical protein
MGKLNDDVTRNLADGFHYNEAQDNQIKCQEQGCDRAGDIKCKLQGSYNEETKSFYPDTYEYFCAEHAGENGYCHCCGTFIAGWIDFGTLCDNCRDEIEANDSWGDDEDDNWNSCGFD